MSTTPTLSRPPGGAAPARRRTRPRRLSMEARRARTAWLFLAPSLIVLALFMVYPMIQAAYLSLTEYNLIRAAEWVGFANYERLVSDPAFWNAFGNTVLYAVVVTPVTVALPLRSTRCA